MGAIVLDTKKVNSYILPSVKQSKSDIITAYNTSVTLKNSLPSSFEKRSLVNQLISQIYNLRKEINDVNTIIEKKVEKAKAIENKSESRTSNISAMASKIGSVVGTMGGATIGAATGGVVGTVVGAVVGDKVGSTVSKGLVNTGAKIWNGATKVAKNIWNGMKNLGKSIWNGCKKIVKKAASFVKEKVFPVVKNIGKAIADGALWLQTQYKRLKATITNLAVSIIEGIVSFVEAIGDVVLLVVGAVCSIFTGIADIIEGCITGNWDWSATSAVWKKWIMPWIGYDWTSNLFDLAYEHNFMGWKTNDELAYGWAKRGAIGYKIGKGVGYYVGIAIATYFTCGAAAGAVAAGNAGAAATAIASASTTTVQAGFVAAGSLGKNTQKNYNKAEEIAKAEGREVTMGEIGLSVAKAGGQAVIDGGTIYVAGVAGDKVAKLGDAGKIIKPVTKIVNKNTVSTGIKTSKAYISEGYSSLVNGEEYNWTEANIDAVATIAAESASILSTQALDKVIKSGIGGNLNPNSSSEGTSVDLSSGDSAEATNVATEEALKEIKKTLGYKIGSEIVKRTAKNTTNELVTAGLESVV